MLTDLFQFIEPFSDWSLHLLLHLSSEQLEPLRSHHLDNRHTEHIFQDSVLQEGSCLCVLVHLQSKLFQLSCFVQQLSSELGQQQLQFLLLNLFVTQQALQFSLNPGELILQAAKKDT